jgi:site-specific recombinase XerD
MKDDLKVSFYLKKNEVNSEGKCPVMGLIRVGKTEAPFSAKTKVHLSLWDTNSGRALGKSNAATNLNRKLDSMNVLVHARYKALSKVTENITAEQVKAAFQGIAIRQTTLIAYFKNYVDNYEKRVGKDRSRSTFKELKNACSHVKKFLKTKYRMTDIPFTSLTHKFIEDYDYHLRIKLRFQSGTILELVSRLRRMIKYAINEGLLSNDPFYEYEPVYPKAKQKYLTLGEVEKIINMQMETDNLNLTKDIFLFSCFTGLAYTDVCNQKEANIVKATDDVLWLKTSRQKTGIPCNIPLLDIPVQIIEKYRGLSTNGKLLPTVSNSFLNRYLKKIAGCCGLNRHLTFHVGRHTYASTITLSQGVCIESVGSMLGHKDLRSTNIYAKTTNEKVEADMESLEEKIGNRYELTQIELAS